MIRRTIQAALAGLLVVASLTAIGGVQPALALDETLTTCDWATFEPAIAAIQASGGGTLTITCEGTIVFANEITITTNVTIIGQDGVVLSGNDSTRLFRVNEGAGLELVALALRDGYANEGGAIYNDGSLNVTAGSFTGNSAYYIGGAILNDGSLTITTSTFSDNSARWEGGAIYHFRGSATITDSTFSGNSATHDGDGGALSNNAWMTIFASTFNGNKAIGNFAEGGAITNFGPLTVTASTFNGNRADYGGALANFDNVTITASTFSGNSAISSGGAIDSANGTATISASIVANNTENDQANCLVNEYDYFPTYSGGSNLSDDASCDFTAPGDIQNSSAINLGPLADNGGPTQTMLPALNSDAINAADCALSSDVDQRGRPRPTSGLFCDIGAVEIGSAAAYCASRYTGALSVPPANGSCPGGTHTLTFPLTASLTICISSYTGALSWTPAGMCAAGSRAYVVPDDGPLAYCQNLYTGGLRYPATGACSAGERPGVIAG